MRRKVGDGQVAAANPPLGTVTDAEREKIIADRQNDAIEKAREEAARTTARMEKASAEERTADLFAAEAKPGQKSADDLKAALGSQFFGKDPAPPAAVVQAPVVPVATAAAPRARMAVEDEGDEVAATVGEEVYGKTGTFSSYRVGPFFGRTKVRAGESRADAARRLLTELRAVADEERARARETFLRHFGQAF